MTATAHTNCQPASPNQRVLSSEKTVYYNTSLATDILNYKLHSHRTNHSLHSIWSDTPTNSNYHYSMRELDRMIEHRTLFSILYTKRILTTPSSTNLLPKYQGIPKFCTTRILRRASNNSNNLLKQYLSVTGMHNSIHSKNIPIWTTPLTVKSTCGGPHCSPQS